MVPESTSVPAMLEASAAEIAIKSDLKSVAFWALVDLAHAHRYHDTCPALSHGFTFDAGLYQSLFGLGVGDQTIA